jgi:hypothetical protein
MAISHGIFKNWLSKADFYRVYAKNKSPSSPSPFSQCGRRGVKINFFPSHILGEGLGVRVLALSP